MMPCRQVSTKREDELLFFKFGGCPLAFGKNQELAQKFSVWSKMLEGKRQIACCANSSASRLSGIEFDMNKLKVARLFFGGRPVIQTAAVKWQCCSRIANEPKKPGLLSSSPWNTILKFQSFSRLLSGSWLAAPSLYYGWVCVKNSLLITSKRPVVYSFFLARKETWNSFQCKELLFPSSHNFSSGFFFLPMDPSRKKKKIENFFVLLFFR